MLFEFVQRLGKPQENNEIFKNMPLPPKVSSYEIKRRNPGIWAGIVLGEISIDGGLQVSVVPLYRAVLAAVQRPAPFGEVTQSERGSRCRPQAAWLSSRNRASCRSGDDTRSARASSSSIWMRAGVELCGNPNRSKRLQPDPSVGIVWRSVDQGTGRTPPLLPEIDSRAFTAYGFGGCRDHGT
jgi:hypothetical protein